MVFEMFVFITCWLFAMDMLEAWTLPTPLESFIIHLFLSLPRPTLRHGSVAPFFCFGASFCCFHYLGVHVYNGLK